MIKIILVITFFILSFLCTNLYWFSSYTWSLKIILNSNTKTIFYDEDLNINISLISDLNEKIDSRYKIDWIENFNINSQEINKDIKLVWDNYLADISIELILNAKWIWYFELWPVKVPYWTGFIESNKIWINTIYSNNIKSGDLEKSINTTKNNYSFIIFIWPLIFIFIILSLYKYIKIIIKNDENNNIFNEINFNSVDDVLNNIWKESIRIKMNNSVIKKEYDEIIYKINELKYSWYKNNLDKNDIKEHLRELYNLLK